MTHHVVIIDDESVPTSYYCHALELDGYRVTHLRSATSCADLLTPDNEKDVDFFVIDVMMPTGSRYSQGATEGGAYTGLLLARDLRIAGHTSPIVLFSNATFSQIRDAAERMADRLNDCIFLRKHETTPFGLADTVNRYFKESKLKPKKKGLLQRIFGGILLQPNIGGVGVDIKKLSE